MTLAHLKYLLLFLAITLLGLRPTQPEIKVRFIGNCALHLTDGTTNLYTDFPYKSGAFGYMKYKEEEIGKVEEGSIFLFTHKHADHYSKKLTRKLEKEKNCQKYSQWNERKLLVYAEKHPDLDIQIFTNKHRFSFKHNSYLLTWHGKRIFFSGDTESAETIGQLKEIDWAFVPPWLIDDAREKGITIDADMIGVYHLYPSEIELAKEEWANEKNIIPIATQGEVIVLD